MAVQLAGRGPLTPRVAGGPHPAAILLAKTPGGSEEALARSPGLHRARRLVHHQHSDDCISVSKYQFLHRSPVGTMKFQKSLPRLPIPPLELTCHRYLESQRALLGPRTEIGDATESAVLKFAADGSQGPKLDSALRDEARGLKHTSYSDKMWSDIRLSDRRPIMMNQSASLGLDLPIEPDLLTRAANVLMSTLRLHQSLRRSLFTPDAEHLNPGATDHRGFWLHRAKYMPDSIATPMAYMFGVVPLDMTPSRYLFQSSRIPQVGGRDTLARFAASKHVVVARKGHFYVFDAYDEVGLMMGPAHYFGCLEHILYHDPEEASDEVGVLASCADRDTWAEARRQLVERAADNQESMSLIDSAVVLICLDDWRHDSSNCSRTVKHLTVAPDPANRWMDKSVNIILSKNGFVGLAYEKSWGESSSLRSWVDELVRENRKQNLFQKPSSSGGPVPKPPSPSVRRLKFRLNPWVKSEIVRVKKEYNSKLASLTFKSLSRGAVHVGSAGLAQDCVMQVALQLAHHKLFGTFVPVSEPCSTMAFRHGRIEMSHPLTLESRRFVEAMNSSCKRPSPVDLHSLLRECSRKHNQLLREASLGQGWDCHLRALMALHVSQDPDQKELPEIFADPRYGYIQRAVLSTDTLKTPSINAVGFCPPNPEGYSIGYTSGKGGCSFHVAAFKDCASSSDLVDGIDAALHEICQVIQVASI